MKTLNDIQGQGLHDVAETMIKKDIVRRAAGCPLAVIGIAVVVLASFSGCASPNNTSSVINPINPILPIGLPPTQPPASSNSFTATQSPGLWSLTVDDTQEQFSYQAVTYPQSPNVPTTGLFLPVAGFISLSGATGVPVGYAAEVPGRALLLQPGDDTAAPVFAVEQDSCFSINGNVRLQFVYMPNQFHTTQQNGGDPVYGSMEVQTTADGSTWTFGNQVQYILPYTLGAPGVGVPIQPGTTSPVSETYLTNFNAPCKVSNGVAAIAAPPNVSSVSPASLQPTTFVLGSTGFFLEDQSTGKQTGVLSADAPSYVGVIEPASPLTASSVVSAKYVGFMREAGRTGLGVTISSTQPIGFGQIVAGSGSSMTGGTYLNDDITQFQNSNIVINLGAQSSTNNGLYPLASVTVPDPQNICFIDPGSGHPGVGGTPGVDIYGNETCTFNAVAVVGNPENKYAIFVASFDPVNNIQMGIYLFQQQ